MGLFDFLKKKKTDAPTASAAPGLTNQPSNDVSVPSSDSGMPAQPDVPATPPVDPAPTPSGDPSNPPSGTPTPPPAV